MGVSLLTALTIQNYGADVAPYGPSGEEEKYGFVIYSIIREKWREHLSSEPFADSADDARKKGREVLKGILDLDLEEDKRDIDDSMGEYAGLVQIIVDASKEGR